METASRSWRNFKLRKTIRGIAISGLGQEEDLREAARRALRCI